MYKIELFVISQLNSLKIPLKKFGMIYRNRLISVNYGYVNGNRV